jgi:hypothetical protein
MAQNTSLLTRPGEPGLRKRQTRAAVAYFPGKPAPRRLSGDTAPASVQAAVRVQSFAPGDDNAMG